MQQIHKRLGEMYDVAEEHPSAQWTGYLSDNSKMFEVKMFEDKQIIVKERGEIKAYFLDLHDSEKSEFISMIRDSIDELSR